ncbi:hypothetical protein BHM03_00030042 [Ensete ventricosum]|nr:hypothetical protein BHM03_00030042 [Ensete ventricosum]
MPHDTGPRRSIGTHMRRTSRLPEERAIAPDPLSTLTSKDYMDDLAHTVQIGPYLKEQGEMSERGFLDIQPTELKFPCNLFSHLCHVIVLLSIHFLWHFRLKQPTRRNIVSAPILGSSYPGPPVMSPALDMISKLPEEKNSATQQNQKLQQELDLLRKERNWHHCSFSVIFVVLVGLLGALIGYIIKKS